MHIVGFFVICQTVNIVILRKPCDALLFVLKHASVQIIGHAGVYGTGWAIHDVDVVFLHGGMVSFRGAAEESLRHRLNLYLGLPEQTMALGIPAHVVRRNDMLVFQGFNPFETQSSIFQGVTLSERTLAACRGPAYRLSGPGQGNQVSGFGPQVRWFP